MDLPVPDVALAAVLAVAFLGAILSGEVTEGPRLVTLPVALLTAGAVLVRSRIPLVSVVVLCAANLTQTFTSETSPGTLMALVAIVAVSYSCGARQDEGRAAVGAVGMLLASYAMEWHDRGSDYAFLTVQIAGAWLLGRAARHLRARATYAEQHQRDLALLAIADERSRIARELHDVVAHSLGVIAVQADAAEAALARDPSLAGAPLRAIRSSARDALDDMRQLLQVLRAPEDPERSPAKGLADLPQLFRGLRETGLPVEAEVSVGEVPPGTGLAAYRIVQEALTNVRKHAGAVATRVEVAQRDDALEIAVRNGPARPSTSRPQLSSGHGLVGARERVLATGGRFHAARTADGGFELLATLPIRTGVLEP
jgi:signal transduction histidine kinase